MRTFTPQNNQEEHVFDRKTNLEMYQCQYCRGYFTPTKRFVQKYCSESCRVMACRERKKGKGNPSTQKTQDISGLHAAAQPKNNSSQTSTSENSGVMAEIKRYMDERDKKLLKEIRSIQSNQEIHMLISGLVPFVAEPIRQKLVSMRKNKTTPTNLNELMQMLEPIAGDLPPELKIQLSQAALSFYKEKK